MGLTSNYNIYGVPSEARSFINNYPKESPETWSDFQNQLQAPNVSEQRRSRFSNMLPTSHSLDAIMQEFRLNGLDSPYDPEEDTVTYPNKDVLIRMGQSGQYLRQKSWPAPDASPAAPLPRCDWNSVSPPFVQASVPAPYEWDAEAARALAALLRALRDAPGAPGGDRQEQAMECRFCKNNGERAAFYRSHRLRRGARVACPVLRALRCRRCGAAGDRAHTASYCPLAAPDDRMKSAAMMRSVRLASGRRRAPPAAPAPAAAAQYVVFGQRPAAALADRRDALDPLWEALEKKLMLYDRTRGESGDASSGGTGQHSSLVAVICWFLLIFL